MKAAIKTIFARRKLLLASGKGRSDAVDGEIQGIEYCSETLGYDLEKDGVATGQVATTPDSEPTKARGPRGN
jgi:hypothetical protein